ncbi:ATPase [Halostagnicola sp. A-GB9-2]|uniref:ATPase n=1 Tax=Halostagnicola sp. A-GB9-2 TaxID=3048066 RepID=UPI0024C051A4|nr:ATPase [Halostagnicola sp. A-GB9-2]MDJ1431832.1 ATPase [Halostagnicola sp. A-GB9-2]
MIFLVVGADHVDAGKTTFSTGLVQRTGGIAFKPRAGNDYWFDHDDCLDALVDGRLYGKDAAKLSRAEDADRPPEALNPVHRLWQPDPDGSTGILGRTDREFVVDRVNRPDDDEPLFVRNGTADIPDTVAEALPLSDSPTVESVEELNELMQGTYTSAFETLASEIASAELAVVESYGDIARPLEALGEDLVSAVAVVEPGQARIYRGSRFCRACTVASSSPGEGTLEKRVPDVIGSIDPVARVPLSPLPKKQRQDPTAIAMAYEPAYNALLEAAEDRS